MVNRLIEHDASTIVNEVEFLSSSSVTPSIQEKEKYSVLANSALHEPGELLETIVEDVTLLYVYALLLLLLLLHGNAYDFIYKT